MKRLLKRVLPRSTINTLRGAADAAARPFRLHRANSVGSRLARYRPGRKTVLFFVPEGGVRLYLIVQAVIGKTLAEAGHNAVFVRCFGVFPRCPMKDSVLLPYDATPQREAEVCLRCHTQTLSVLDAYDLDYLDAREFFDDAAAARVRDAMAGLPEDRLAFEHDGIRIGKLAFYDFAIAAKHPIEVALSPTAQIKYDRYIENCLVTIEVVKAMRKRLKFDAIACFDEYAMMSCARLAFKDAPLPARMMSVAYHFNGDPRRILAMSNPTVVKEQSWRASHWQQWRDLPLPPETIAEITGDLIFRLAGSGAHIYSPNKTTGAESLLEHFRLSGERRLLVAYPSSGDEYDALKYNMQGLGVAAELHEDAFRDQFEWLHALIEHVEASADLQLILRLHPRIGATPRDGVRSPDYDRYHREFSGAYKHCRIVWPEEKISSYDIAELADGALVSWSTVGLEMARFGMPVLTGCTSIVTVAPPGEEFIRMARNRVEYFEMLEAMTASPVPTRAKALRLAYRWYNMFYLGNSIDVLDLPITADRLPPFRLPRNAQLIESIMLGAGEAMDFNLEQLRRCQRADSPASETAALRGQIGRLVHFLVTGTDPKEAVQLTITEGANPSLPGPRAGALWLEGNRVSYSHRGRPLQRYSPMIARLGRIHGALNEG